MTFVHGWWLSEPATEPEWWPVMGPLHDDAEFFGFQVLHYHVDPRFLTRRQAAAATERQRRAVFVDKPWHPAYQMVLTHFAVDRGSNAWWKDDRAAASATGCILIAKGRTAIVERTTGLVEQHVGESWGRGMIRRRTREARCRRRLPPARIDAERDRGFHEIRQRWCGVEGDVCPHRGYDLRNVPVDRDGYRQCPLHQLRVRAPAARREQQR